MLAALCHASALVASICDPITLKPAVTPQAIEDIKTADAEKDMCLQLLLQYDLDKVGVGKVWKCAASIPASTRPNPCLNLSRS